MDLFSPNGIPMQVLQLLATLVLCSIIGIERQVHQKAAGYRTNVLVGLGSCTFTLVSAHGFSSILGNDATLDPSRIAAQIVSGIGFLGAGVIFKGRNVVRGLTTAATVWVSAAVGMACAAEMVTVAAALTLAHMVTLFGMTPLVRRIPGPDNRQMVQVKYTDGMGVLRHIIETSTAMGFGALIDSTDRSKEDGEAVVTADMQFRGRLPVSRVVEQITEIDGVRSVSVKRREYEGDDEDDDE